MSDFAKEKIAFAVGLLAVLFTVTPLLSEIGALGFSLFGVRITISLLYYSLSALLALAVYCYGVQFAFQWPRKALTIVGDVFYALAIAAPVAFILLFAGTELAGLLGRVLQSELARTVGTGLFGVMSGALASQLAYLTRKALSQKQRDAELRLSADEGVLQLRRAQQLTNSGHYDLGIIEAFRAVESAARRSALMRNVPFSARWFTALADQLPTPELRTDFDAFKRLRNVAAHAVERISAEQASQSLAIAARLLSFLSGEAV